MITPDVLDALGIGAEWSRPLNNAMALYDIGDAREPMFIAQCAHESQGFTVLVENLNYGAAGLLATFGKYFTPAEAVTFAHDGERIANRVYANRLGNGDEASGDGWTYRGRGVIQLTGRNNVLRCGRALGVDLVNKPELLEEQTHAILSAAWFWSSNGCNELADVGNFTGTTRRINGGINGQASRDDWLRRVRKAMA